jgi:hypothetical protein
MNQAGRRSLAFEPPRSRLFPLARPKPSECLPSLPRAPRTSIVRGLLGRLLAPDADSEIQMDVVIGDKAVLEVASKARVGGGVNALRDRSAQHRLGVGGLDDVQRRPSTMAAGKTFYVRAERTLVVFSDSSAHGERDKGSGQGGPFARQPVVDAPV